MTTPAGPDVVLEPMTAGRYPSWRADLVVAYAEDKGGRKTL